MPMRRRFAAFPTALLLLALLAPAVVAGQTAPSTPGLVVSSQPVNVRECPRADCAVRFGARPARRWT
jgi:hypothetical protein